jgi:alpha-mannosidase
VVVVYKTHFDLGYTDMASNVVQRHHTTMIDQALLPLQAEFADGASGPLPAEQAGVTLSRAGIQVTAFGPNPDGAGTVLRLWEMSGEGGSCNVRLPAGGGFVAAQPVNLRGEPAGDLIAVARNEFRATPERFAPGSFVLTKGGVR